LPWPATPALKAHSTIRAVTGITPLTRQPVELTLGVDAQKELDAPILTIVAQLALAVGALSLCIAWPSPRSKGTAGSSTQCTQGRRVICCWAVASFQAAARLLDPAGAVSGQAVKACATDPMGWPVRALPIDGAPSPKHRGQA